MLAKKLEITEQKKEISWPHWDIFS